MTTGTAPLTHCPTCGVKLHRTDLSLCAYCASPLRIGSSAAPPDDETQRLLRKIETHPQYAAALQWTPPDPAVEARVTSLRSWGTTAIVLALLAVAAGSLFRGKEMFGRGLQGSSAAIVAVALILAGAGLLVAASALRSSSRRKPLLRRPARVLDRRSRTESSERVGATTYLFQLRFADGSEGEFRLPGRGTMNEPPTVGATGIAYSRGADLLEFKRL
jgi:hypothetical protein